MSEETRSVCVDVEVAPENSVRDQPAQWPTVAAEGDASNDHFVTRRDEEFAGVHIIADFWDAAFLDDLEHIETALREAVSAGGATLLHVHLHRFASSGGVSGVAVLAESHISVHTWPERDYAAFDVFMCGDTAPERSIEVLRAAFRPSRVQLIRHHRGSHDSHA
jgi:S-adenosylmethionine decarboxylase